MKSKTVSIREKVLVLMFMVAMAALTYQTIKVEKLEENLIIADQTTVYEHIEIHNPKSATMFETTWTIKYNSIPLPKVGELDLLIRENHNGSCKINVELKKLPDLSFYFGDSISFTATTWDSVRFINDSLSVISLNIIGSE